MKRNSVWPGLFIGVILVCSAELYAQSLWFDYSDTRVLSVEMLQPNFEHLRQSSEGRFTYERDYSSNTSALFIGLRWPVSASVVFVSDLPVVHAKAKTRFEYDFGSFNGSESENKIGNPYLGFELGKRTAPFFTELGLRLSLILDENNFAALAGAISDLDRGEAFGEAYAVRALVNFRRQNNAGFALRLRAGPIAMLHLGTAGEDYLALIYGGCLGYEAKHYGVEASLSGRIELRRYVDQNRHQLGAEAHYNFGRVRPGVYLGLPLDYQLIHSILGVHLGLRLE